jgi:hypothetical protein
MAYVDCFINGMKNTVFIAAALTVSLFASACSSVPATTGGIRIGSTAASRIAKDTHIPGKGVSGQCLPFAQALQQKFAAAGIPSRIMIFGYEVAPMPAMGSAPSGHMGDRMSHAVVAYEDGGRTYIMDNQSWSPQWVHDAAPMQMAQQFAGLNSQVHMARMMDGGTPQSPTPALPASGLQVAAR